ncbi:MAG: glycoside hydrolase family 3 protein [Calditrichaeota bacterium]|nr:glycoside hydrolase family 3 protein [Calditrichota bacterium]
MIKNYLYILIFALSISCSQNAELDKQIGQLLMVGFRGLTVNESKTIRRDIEQYQVGSVVLFDYDVATKTPVRNVESAQQLRKLISDLQAISKTKLIVSIDQEGGKIRRLKEKFGFPKTVSAQHLGDINNYDSTYVYSLEMASTLNQLGINMNLAPVLDVNVNPENPIIGALERSFSGDAMEVATHAKFFIKAHHDKNVLTALKHFPGHGSSKSDSHLGLVDISDTWTCDELYPYEFLIDSAYADAIMTAHVFNSKIDENDPATLSHQAITGLLREQLHWNGVIISDDMMMGAITQHYGLKIAIEKAINAGVDMLSFANNGSEFDPDITKKAFELIHQLVDEGKISAERIKQSYQRIIKLKERI